VKPIFCFLRWVPLNFVIILVFVLKVFDLSGTIKFHQLSEWETELAGSVAVNSSRFKGPLQTLPHSIACTRHMFFCLAFYEINTQLTCLDKLTKLSQAKSLHNSSPRMKLPSRYSFTSRKEAKEVIVAGVSYVASWSTSGH